MSIDSHSSNLSVCFSNLKLNPPLRRLIWVWLDWMIIDLRKEDYTETSWKPFYLHLSPSLPSSTIILKSGFTPFNLHFFIHSPFQSHNMTHFKSHRSSTSKTFYFILSKLIPQALTYSTPDPKVDFLPNQTLPSYALDFAPYVYLHSQEIYWPSEIKTHLSNVQPEFNFSVINGFDTNSGGSTETFLHADKLKESPHQTEVYLTSRSDVFKDPKDPWSVHHVSSNLHFC